MAKALFDLTCPYHLAKKFRHLYSGVEDQLHPAPGSYSFARCKGCGSALQVTIPKLEELGSFYPKNYGYVPTAHAGKERVTRIPSA